MNKQLTDKAICIHDPTQKKPCLLGDPNLCLHNYYFECLEVNGRQEKTPREPTPAVSPNAPLWQNAPSPITGNYPKDENGISDAYDAKTQKISMIEKSEIDFTNEEFNFELVTFSLKEFIKKENSNSKEFAKLLIKVKEKFFSEKGKKKGWKDYIEKTIGYSYRQTQNLIKGYQNPIILEYWDQLGIAKISLLNRFREKIVPELIPEIISVSVSETKKILFSALTESKHKPNKIERLIKEIKSIKPEELSSKTKRKLMLVLEQTIKNLK